MAFRQPTLPPAAKVIPLPLPLPASDQQSASPTRPTVSHALDDSQEWILFPKTRPVPNPQTASTNRTPRTAGLSRLSDFGSLNTVARTGEDADRHCETTLGSETGDEDLDGLDDGLHAFHDSGLQQRSGYFDQSFPRHDGLGTFPPASPDMQDQIWHFEQHNPRKRSFASHRRRRSSVQRRLDAVEEDDAAKVEYEKRERIEKWRLDHSKILLDEMERETRKRQSAANSLGVEQSRESSAAGQSTPKTVKSMTERSNVEQPSVQKPCSNDESESMLQRITRRVIRDFMGIDEATLSVIFGEALPTDVTIPEPSQASAHSTQWAPTVSLLWETRLLNRLGRELGILFSQLTEHPGAFSTPSLFSISNPDYAGIPITQPTSSRTHSRRRSLNSTLSAPPPPPPFNVAAQSQFSAKARATAANAAEADSRHASLWGIDEEPSQSADQEYWSQPPSLRTAFRLLHNHFTAARRAPPAPNPLNLATAPTPDSLRRAAVIRQYHPLVSRAAANHWHTYSRRGSLHFSKGYAASSCGSQSLRRSRRATGTTTTASLGSSSRNFWDLGGSATGSVGGGGWGEV